MTSQELAKNIYQYIDEKKGIDIKIIDISKISVLADYFIIAGGSNLRQVQTIADNIEEKLGKETAAQLKKNADEIFENLELDVIEPHMPKKFLGVWR
jgi:ribosome silencing factor RsfS/YbeB/iojap